MKNVKKRKFIEEEKNEDEKKDEDEKEKKNQEEKEDLFLWILKNFNKKILKKKNEIINEKNIENLSFLQKIEQERCKKIFFPQKFIESLKNIPMVKKLFIIFILL